MPIIKRLMACVMVVTLASAAAFAEGEDVDALKREAKTLFDSQKLTEALPIYEKLAKLVPGDVDIQRKLAFALMGMATNTKDPAAAKALRVRARAAWIKARDLGDDSQLVSGMIDSIPPDGTEASFTAHQKAQEIMRKGEAAFTSGKMDEALALYQEALKLDPKLYYAALFSADVYMHKEKFPDAEVWYQRAITIDPNIETAYRYSATPLMKQKKYDQARDRYIEAWITEPYSKFAVQGMINWGQITQTGLGHPKVDIPETKVGEDGKENTAITVNPLVDDGSMAWIAYSSTRSSWKKDKFSKAFPAEKAYRHSLAEEADALRSVVSMARSLKPKTLNPQIELIEKMDKDGVLEAFILMAIPDRGIAQDHAAYLKTNRDKLRKYVVDHVIEKK